MCIQLRCPPDYWLWLETMYNLFGTKCCHMFSGPMWGYEPIAQSNEDQQSEIEKDPIKITYLSMLTVINYFNYKGTG